MCKTYGILQAKLMDWKKELKMTNNEAIFNASMDDNSASADIVDQQVLIQKKCEMRAIRQIKLI